MALPTKEEMRTRFWFLKNVIDAAEASTAALREKYEPGWNADVERRRAETAEIKAIESSLGDEGLSMFDAKQELAFLARGLGNVGSDPALASEE